MRQQALALMVIGTLALAGTLSSTVASAAAPPPASAAQTALAQEIISTAEQYLGYNYSWVGSSPQTGFSCVGLVYYVYTHLHGVPTGTDLESAYASGPHVARTDLQPADLVFFSGTVSGMWPLSHVAIYVGNGKMIAADSFQTGVEWDNLNDAYWSAHYAGAARPLAAFFGTAVPPYTDPPPASGAGNAATPVTGTAPTVQETVTVQAVAVTATAPKGTPLVVNQTSVVVRSGPDTTYMSMESVGVGMAMVVIEAQGIWYHVTLNDGQVGWVPASAVRIVQNVGGANNSGEATTAPATIVTRKVPSPAGQPSKRMAVSADMLKVHVRPGLSSPLVGRFAYGTVVTILQAGRDWDLVESGGTQGSIFNHYLSADLALATKGSGTVAPRVPKPSTKVAAFKQTSPYQVVVVVADALKVHVSPTLQAAVITRVHGGDRLRVLRWGGRWLYIMARGGLRGWVSAQWVRQETASAGESD